MLRSLTLCALNALVLAAAPALAGEADPATLYEVTTRGSTEKVKKGEKGKVVVEIRAKSGAHVSDEAPLKLELTGKSVQLEKQKLSLKDSVASKQAGQKYADPRFEVLFAGSEVGKGAVDAKLTFFICTDTICARQQKNLTVPIQVE